MTYTRGSSVFTEKKLLKLIKNKVYLNNDMTDLYHQRTYWQNFTSQASHDVLASDLNPTWDKEKQEYKEQTSIDEKCLEILRKQTDLSTALDFGAGLGRNINALKNDFDRVFAYDTIEMCARLNSRNLNYEMIMHKWDDVTNIAQQINGFDLIYECTVFQHMPPQDVLHKLMSGSYLSKYLYMHTRSYNDMFRFKGDGGVNMLKLVESVHAWDIIYATKQPSEVSELMDETHYAMLLKSSK